MALYTVESLLSVRGGQFWIYRVVLLGCIAALASLPLIEIDVSVNAPGLVRPSSEARRGATALWRGELDDARYALDRVRAEGKLLIEQARIRWQMRGEEEAAALANLTSEAKLLESGRARALVRSPV